MLSIFYLRCYVSWFIFITNYCREFIFEYRNFVRLGQQFFGLNRVYEAIVKLIYCDKVSEVKIN